MIRTHGILLLALGSAVAAGCGKNDAPSHEAADTTPLSGRAGSAATGASMLPMSVTFTAAQIEHGGVRWGPAAMGTAAASVTVPGEVTPNEDRTARLGAPARGRVLSVSVRPGDEVSGGQVLVTLQSPDAGMAQSDVAKAEAERGARRAEAQYAASARARAERLLALKAIPRQDYERAITDDEHARSALAQADAEARRARTTADQLSAGGGASGEIVLRAPAAGVVLARTAMPGAVVEAGAPLIVITDPRSLWLTIAVPEPLAPLFRRGGRLRFTVSAYPHDTSVARVDAVGAGLEPDTRTLSVRAVIAASSRLKPQMLATVIVDGVGGAPAAFVPEESVQVIQGTPSVFLAHPDGKGGARFERRDVTVGTRAGGTVAVLRGLSAGDVVVTAGAFAVRAELQKATMPKMEM